jgi:hypothetical protein
MTRALHSQTPQEDSDQRPFPQLPEPGCLVPAVQPKPSHPMRKVRVASSTPPSPATYTYRQGVIKCGDALTPAYTGWVMGPVWLSGRSHLSLGRGISGGTLTYPLLPSVTTIHAMRTVTVPASQSCHPHRKAISSEQVRKHSLLLPVNSSHCPLRPHKTPTLVGILPPCKVCLPYAALSLCSASKEPPYRNGLCSYKLCALRRVP